MIPGRIGTSPLFTPAAGRHDRRAMSRLSGRRLQRALRRRHPRRYPDRDGSHEVIRHVLFDVGNVLAGEGGDDAVFEPIVRDILDRLDGRPIDLYVMSHEHLDHVQGLRYAAARGLPAPVSFAWLTASAAPDYRARFPTTARKLAIAQDHFEVVKVAAARRGLLEDPFVRTFLANNDRANTQADVEYLRMVAPVTRYVHRGFRPRTRIDHPFAEATFRIWGPEEDTTTYYGRVTPFVAKVAAGAKPRPASIARPFGS